MWLFLFSQSQEMIFLDIQWSAWKAAHRQLTASEIPQGSAVPAPPLCI